MRHALLAAGNSPLRAGLVGYWAFEAASGSVVADRSGNGNQGTWGGTLGSQWGAGKIGGGGVFNGSNNVVNCGSAASLNLTTDFTMAGWFQTAAPTIRYDVLGNMAFHVGGASLRFDSTGAILFVAQNSTAQTAPSTATGLVTANTWYHVAGVRSGSALLLYVNGAFITSTSVALMLVGPGTFRMGNAAGGTSLSGLVDECGYWSRALTAAEIQQLYANGQGYRPV